MCPTSGPNAPTEAEVGAPAPARRRGVLILTVGEHAGRVIPVDDSKPIRFGRSDDCTWVLADPSLSRLHAEVVRAGSDHLISDLGSTNGTFVNDERIDGVVHLADGDRIRLGQSRLRFALLDEEEGEALLGMSAAARATSLGAPPRLAGMGAEESDVVLEPEMIALYEEARRAAQARVPVLLLGETGVGKEVLAHFIHRASPRASAPMMALNCAALSESLLEAELFGHEKGAFTGATSARLGVFEAADGGTVFLDEVGELPAAVQVKLLRVLEDRMVTRIGARSAKQVDVRFVAATHRDLDHEVAEGRFRQDLLFRLNTMTLDIPPLRRRPSELVPLAERFVTLACRQMGRLDRPALSRDFEQALATHTWPGNVRELRNVVERAVVLCDGSELLATHLPQRLREAAPRSVSLPERPTTDSSLDSAINSAEKQRILEVLDECRGNQTMAAEILGVSRRTLVSRLSAWGMTRPRRQRSDG